MKGSGLKKLFLVLVILIVAGFITKALIGKFTGQPTGWVEIKGEKSRLIKASLKITSVRNDYVSYRILLEAADKDDFRSSKWCKTSLPSVNSLKELESKTLEQFHRSEKAIKGPKLILHIESVDGNEIKLRFHGIFMGNSYHGEVFIPNVEFKVVND